MLDKIIIYSRGKNRDVYGNPYYALKIILKYSYVSYFQQIIIPVSMKYGSSSKRDCLMWAGQALQEALGMNIEHVLPFIEHHHVRVSRDSQLKNPLKWKEDEE